MTESLHEKGENPQMMVLDDNQEYTVIQNHINPLTDKNNSITREILNTFQVGYEIDIIDPILHIVK